MPRIKKAGPWNPQKATAYVGKGVLKYGDTIPAIRGSFTPVPNGPLVKKKGEFKGSTLKNGGVKKIKKAQDGEKINPKVYLEGSRKRVKAVVDSARKQEVKKGIKTYDDYLKSKIKKQRSGGSTPAWQRKEGKDPKGGLNRKGIASYRRQNPGSKLSMAVTTPPSKLKPGSKAANRRKSFCARMSGVKGPMRKPNGKPTRKALALRKWNC